MFDHVRIPRVNLLNKWVTSNLTATITRRSKATAGGVARSGEPDRAGLKICAGVPIRVQHVDYRQASCRSWFGPPEPAKRREPLMFWRLCRTLSADRGQRDRFSRYACGIRTVSIMYSCAFAVLIPPQVTLASLALRSLLVPLTVSVLGLSSV